MNNQFIKAIEKRLTYRREPSTKVSFHRQPGSSDVLPLRVNFWTDPEGFRRTSQSGRAGTYKKVAELKARFTRKDDRSPYRIYNGGAEERISFSVWECKEYPLLWGFADVGRTNENAKMEGTQDLVVIVRTLDNCSDTMEVRVYPGFYPQREAVLAMLNDELRGQSPAVI
jgi:hypothetical protein